MSRYTMKQSVMEWWMMMMLKLEGMTFALCNLHSWSGLHWPFNTLKPLNRSTIFVWESSPRARELWRRAVKRKEQELRRRRSFMLARYFRLLGVSLAWRDLTEVVKKARVVPVQDEVTDDERKKKKKDKQKNTQSTNAPAKWVSHFLIISASG